jgi:hypothetical protein
MKGFFMTEQIKRPAPIYIYRHPLLRTLKMDFDFTD